MFGISPYMLISVHASFYNLRCKYPKHWPSIGIEIKSHGKSGALPLKGMVQMCCWNGPHFYLGDISIGMVSVLIVYD